MTLKRKIFVFIFLCIIVHIVLCLLFYFFNDRKNELVLRFHDYKKHHHSARILFMGDSHTERSINYKEINDSYSLAYYGENNVMNYYRLKYCIDKNIAKPHYVVFACDLVTFTKGGNQYRTNTLFYNSFIPLSEFKYFEPDVFNAYYKYFKTELFPYIEWQYALNYTSEHRIKKGKDKFSDKSLDKQQRNARHFIQDELMCKENKANLFYSTALQYLEKTISLCKNNNIKLIYVKYPLTNAVFDEVKNNVDSSYITHRPSEEIIKLNTLPILNFEHVFNNHPELFFDAHHLNDEGKKIFTGIFKQKIDSLLNIY